MGNCGAKCDRYVSPHERHALPIRCNRQISTEGLLDSETTNLLVFQRENDQIGGTSSTIQPSKKLGCHGVDNVGPMQVEDGRNIDPKPVESIRKKVQRKALTSIVNSNNASIVKQARVTGEGNSADAHQAKGYKSRLDLKETFAAEDEKNSQKSAGDLHIYVVTWNMNGKAPVNNLVKLLDLTAEKYDFYVIGLQEAPNLIGEAAIADALGDTYCCVAAAIMMSLQLYVFAKRSLQRHISGPMVDRVGVGGFGTVVGRQKGAVAVTLLYKKVSLLFITSHLSPHECNLEERNAQYMRICQNVFAKHVSVISSSCSCMQSSAVADEPHCKVPEPTSNFVEEADAVIWLGDLNYRIEMARKSVGFLINHNLEEVLWAKDQLSRAVKRGEVFNGFEEGPLLFPPTYKYDIGTDNYDTSSKERVPSWTDRILYKVSTTSSLQAEVQDYTCINAIKSSDHKPVKAHIALTNRSFVSQSK